MAVDLHLHTTASDGSLTPEQLVKKAAELDYQAIAITDHDTVGGLEEALSWGKRVDLEVIPGIEINTEYDGHEVHILGYYIDFYNKKLRNTLQYYRKLRKKRVVKIINKLNDLNINIYSQEVMNLAGSGSVGRTHIAQVMKEKGYVSTTAEAFNKYIGIGETAYVNRERLSPERSIDLINKCDGIPVLAHPGLVENDLIVKKIISMGIKGLEVYYYEHNKKQTEKYLQLARKNNLLVTGGSDDHGPGNKDGARLGKIRLDYSLVNELKECINFV